MFRKKNVRFCKKCKILKQNMKNFAKKLEILLKNEKTVPKSEQFCKK